MSAWFDGPAAPLLRLPAWLYAHAVARRNRRYDSPGAAMHAACPVISVGNLSVGGTGKTPLVQWLARRLLEFGRKPAVVSRGYGGRAAAPPLVVSTGDGPICEASICGDEPFLLARSLAGVGVIVDPVRPRGAARAAELGYDVILLDDGFQHRRLARDLDLVLLDASRPFGNGRLLPAGPLREPPTALARAGAIVVTGWRPDMALDPINSAVAAAGASRVPILRADRHAEGWYDPGGGVAPAPARVLAFCGIGNPQRFRDDLVGLGVELVGFAAFRDHHRFSARELDQLASRAAAAGAVPVTTEKDLARLPAARWRAAFGDGAPLGSRLGVGFPDDDAERLIALVMHAIGDRGR